MEYSHFNDEIESDYDPAKSFDRFTSGFSIGALLVFALVIAYQFIR